MVLRRLVSATIPMMVSLVLLTGLAGLAVPARAAQDGAPGLGPGSGEVVLPLKDYLSLIESAEAAQKARAERAKQQAVPLAEVVSQSTSAVLEDGEARVTTEIEVLIQGHPDKPIALPLAGYPAVVELLRDGRPEPGAAVSALPGGRGGVLLVAPVPGVYKVKAQGRTAVENLGGIGRLTFPPASAPVSVTEVDLPAETAWTAPGGVIVEEREQGARRIVRLAGKRGEAQTLELKRRFDSVDSERLLAQAVVLTLFQLRPEGPRRHDVILYEVSRGSLPGFTVSLPPGVEVEQSGTDEGAAVPTVDAASLTVHRHRQLKGTGYLVLTSTPPASVLADGTSLLPALPQGVDVRARFLAVASSVAAEARPLPEAAWVRVDLSDLPPALSEALAVVDLAAAWRLAGAAPEGMRLAIQALPAAPSLDEPIHLRDTTTLLTVDDKLLHRDRFMLGPVTKPGAALEMTLPEGAALWSARVGEQPVRPVERNGRMYVPLGFASGSETEVEVVSVLERAIPAGRSELSLTLPQVAAPVLEHRWRVLLPEANRYRFRSGDLRPTPVPALRFVDTPPPIPGPWDVPSAYGGTASIFGRVLDDQSQELPGATLTLSTAGLSPIVTVSDAKGQFRFLGLPSASFTLKAALEGFSSIEYPGLKATAGRNTAVELTMTAAVEDAITVTAESPLLDQRRISTGATIPLNESTGGGLDLDFQKRIKNGATFSAEELAKIPTARDSFEELKRGLVGGVKPLPVEIPESGKALYLVGALPPAQVSLVLDVKTKRP